MCKPKRYERNPRNRIDKCMQGLIDFINTHPNVKTLGCCCGHGKYDMSIVVKHKTGLDGKWKWEIMELCTRTALPRKRNFYKRDKEGYYYIPEMIEK